LFCQLRIERRNGRRRAVIGRREFALRFAETGSFFLEVGTRGGAMRVGGGEEEASSRFVTISRLVVAASRFATSPPAPFVEARARCAAASPPARRSHELSGGGCKPVEEPTPLSPRLIAGLSSSASAGPIGCTSGREALEAGAFDFGVLPGFLGFCGVFAIRRIWDESGAEKRAKAVVCGVEGTSLAALRCVVSTCQHLGLVVRDGAKRLLTKRVNFVPHIKTSS
jgi:hypothetical protein